MSERGVSILEVLVASALVVAISGAVAAIVAPLRDVVARADARAELDASPRAALQQVAADLREAGADAAIGPSGTRLSRVLPRVVSLKSLEEEVHVRPGTAVRVSYTPRLAAQGVLSDPAFAGDTIIRLDTSSRCATGPPACGFRGGESAVIYTHVSSVQVFVAGAAVDAATLASPLPAAAPAGAVMSELVSVTYGTRLSADGSFRLVRRTTAGAEQPLVDNVVEFVAMPDQDNPLLTEHVSLRLRLQVPSAELRGPAGYLFRRGGTSAHARRWIPDVELRMEVALRNPTGAS